MTVHITIVLDRSGSMEAMAADAIGGFNAFLAQQRADGSDATVTLVQFDSQAIDTVYRDQPIASAPELTAATFQPRGGTPLYDAIAQTMADVQARIRRDGSDPQDELFVILTDGHENASQRCDRDGCFRLIRQATADGWTFAYLGANQDAFAVGGGLGLVGMSSRSYDATPAAMRRSWDEVSHSASRLRSERREGRQKSDFFAPGWGGGRRVRFVCNPRGITALDVLASLSGGSAESDSRTVAGRGSRRSGR